MRNDLSLGINGEGRVNFEFINNTVANSNRSILVNDSRSSRERFLSMTVSGNYFLNNIQTTDGMVEIQDSNNEYLSIENNVFENNLVFNLIVISGPIGLSSSDRSIDIRANQFVSNTALKSFVTMSNCHPLRLRKNVFGPGSAPCYFQAPGFNAMYSIDARRNYWGTSDVADVMDRVCGFEKNMDHSLVYYIPYYTDTALSTLSAHLQEDVTIEGFTGGEFTSDIVFPSPAFQSPIMITRSIFIK